MIKFSNKNKKGGIFEFLKTVLIALIFAGLIRTLFFQPFWIPSGSMKPGLLVGDFIFVNKFAYGYSRYSCPLSLCPFRGRIIPKEPNRGDVVVFRNPTNGKDFVKRLVGMPGDEIYLQKGKIWLNGNFIEYEREKDFLEIKSPQGPLSSIPRCSNSPVAMGADCKKQQFTEILDNDVSYKILDIWESGADDTIKLTVPSDNYFFLGDNRDNSLDSRFSLSSGGIGLVPSDYLIGRADLIFFSSAGSSIFSFWTWRVDRFLKAIK